MNTSSGKVRRAGWLSGGSSIATGAGILELFPASTVKGAASSVGGKRQTKSDFVVVSSRSSIKQLYDVISSFDDRKKQLVRSSGFGGVLMFPPLRQINRRFAVWLMSRVDPLSQTLAINESVRIKFNKSDVERVFGIPCKGKRISDHGVPRKDVVTKIMCGYLGSKTTDNRSIKSVLEVLQRDYGADMSRSDEDSFKVAFVIYVMSTLLCPGGKYDYISGDYWNALVDPDQIHTFDWAEFVIKRLFAAVVKVNAELKTSNKVGNITGCSLFLQVLYLDSIDIGFLNLEHNCFPRIMCFSPDTMKPMILADTISGPEDDNECEFGKSKIRQADGICYSWASSTESSRAVARTDEGLAELWEVASSLSRSLGIHTEVAGPLFFVVSEFGAETTCYPCQTLTTFASVLSELINPFSKGFRYNIGRQFSLWREGGCDPEGMLFHTGEHGTCCCNSSCHSKFVHIGGSDADEHLRKRARGSGPVLCDVRKSRRCRFCLGKYVRDTARFYPMIDWKVQSRLSAPLLKHAIVARVMARYYMVFRCSNCPKATSNDSSQMDIVRDISGKDDGLMVDVVTKPWDIGAKRSISCAGNGEWSYKDLVQTLSISDGSVMALCHYSPKHIEVSVSDMKAQVTRGSEFGLDLFDGIIRRFKEHDDLLYTSKSCGRWRHYLESDFLESIIAGYFDVSDPVVRQQFIGPHINYNVSLCRMFFFPGILKHRWVCYAWSLDDNKITVFDQTGRDVENELLIELHGFVGSMLKTAMEHVAAKFFPQWSHDWAGAEVVVLPLNSFDLRLNRSGLGCAQFVFSFDGSAGSLQHSQDYSTGLIYALISDTLELGGNTGKLILSA